MGVNAKYFFKLPVKWMSMQSYFLRLPVKWISIQSYFLRLPVKWIWSTIIFPWMGTRVAQPVVCCARSPVWCSVVGSILLWASGREDFSPWSYHGFWLHFPKTLSEERINQGLVMCTYAFHRTDSKDSDIHVLDWGMLARTHPACTIHEDGMWLL